MLNDLIDMQLVTVLFGSNCIYMKMMKAYFHWISTTVFIKTAIALKLIQLKKIHLIKSFVCTIETRPGIQQCQAQGLVVCP